LTAQFAVRHHRVAVRLRRPARKAPDVGNRAL